MKQFGHHIQVIKTHGFTVVELIVVIVIIGILATIGLTSYNGAQRRAYDIAIIADADAMDGALTNEQVNNAAGTVEFGDVDGDGKDDGYHYSEDLADNPTIMALNQKLDFKPTRGNIVDVKTTANGKEYCIRVYNEKAEVWNTAFNAYQRASSNKVEGDVDSCEYQEGEEPTVYSGGAIPGAYEEIYHENATYDWSAHRAGNGMLPERVEVAIIAGGGNGNGYCGGGGGGVWTAVIPRDGNPGPFAIVVGSENVGGAAGPPAAASSFGPYTATAGANPNNGCSTLSVGSPGGVGGTTNGPDGQPSHKYGAGGNGGNGAAYVLLATLVAFPGGNGLTGGGGAGSGALLGVSGTNGGNGVFGGGGGGGAGTMLLGLGCTAAGSGGNAQGGGAGQSGYGCSGTNKGWGGNGAVGGGGGGASNIGGAQPGKGGKGMVRVLTCFEATCNPIETPIP